jgi:acetylornithine deacetylase/succinyl-diaminopimelate desuccinylase-like protein
VIDPVELLEELVGIDSANPAMGGPGEREIVARLVEILRDLGLEVSTPEVVDGRRNLIATLPGSSGAPTLLLEAHLDTVAMPAEGFAVSRTEDCLIGRGSCDTKGSAAAMVAAMAELLGAGEERATVVFAGVADEEDRMVGSRALVDQLPPVDAAVIGEPTSLEPVRVHNGLARITIETHGRAAHTSRAHLGVNAISAASRVVASLEEHLLPRLKARAHPLAGPALLTPAVIHGGVAPNVVPNHCRLSLDRRLAPGENPDAALAEIDELLEGLRKRGDRITRESPWLLLEAVETPADHPVVRLAEESVEAALGRPVTAGGVPYGTDASNLSGVGGIPCVVLGPGSIDQAHTDDEWVPLEEIRRAAAVYAEMARRFARHHAERGSAR